MAASSSASAGWQLVSVDHAAVIDIPHDALCLQLGRNQLAEAASRANAPQVEFAFVSRVQLALTAGTEGALKLESLGTNAILVSSGGTGPWEKLCRGETRTLLAGDKIAFDNKWRTGTVVQLRRCGGSPSPDNISSAARSFAVCCEDQVPEGGAKRPRNQMSLSDRVGADRRISWDGTRFETLEDWLSSVPPSKVSPEVAAWIHVQNITNMPRFFGNNFPRPTKLCDVVKHPF